MKSVCVASLKKRILQTQRSGEASWLFLFIFLLVSVVHLKTSLADKVDIRTEGCEDLDIEETTRLVTLELSDLLQEQGAEHPLVVELTCKDNVIQISVYDSVTNRSVARSIEEINQNVKERVVALSASQLIGVARMNRAADGEPTESIDAVEPEGEATTDSLAEEEKRFIPKGAIFLSGGVNLRSKFTLVLGTAGIRGDLLLNPHIGLTLLIDFEGGSTSRRAGNVTSLATLAGGGVVGRLFQRRRFFFDLGLAAKLGYAYLKGNPAAWASGRSAGAITADFSLRAAPTIKLDFVLLSVALKGGYTLDTLVGEITDDETVVFGGFWMGFDVCVGLELGPKKK